MRRFRYCISSLIIAFLLTSCSSAIHRVGFSGPGIVGPRGTGIGYESIYIGARKNAEALYKDPLSLLVVLIDFPFSATLDTVMFPIDVVVGTYSLGARADRERPPSGTARPCHDQRWQNGSARQQGHRHMAGKRELTQEELNLISDQQHLIRHPTLFRHLLTLPGPPQDWKALGERLDKQVQQATHYDITHKTSLILFVEAMHYVPDALNYETPMGYLTSGGWRYFGPKDFWTGPKTIRSAPISYRKKNLGG